MGASQDNTVDQATMGACPVAHHGYEPFQQNDPFPAYQNLRDEEPVMYDERIDCWVVTRHADVKEVFRDWETARLRERAGPRARTRTRSQADHERWRVHGVLGLSARVPPRLTRIRSTIVQKAFTAIFKSWNPSSGTT